MSVFNSLGSNYDLNFALKALFSSGKNNLKKFLEEKYGGQVILLFKGREAVTLSLKILNLPKGSGVAINGFTCYAVYRGIEEAGLKPMLIDVPEDELNFSVKDLEKTLDKNPEIKAVIIQNTLGSPCNIEEISRVLKTKNIPLIEDLAHSIGTVYKNGKEAGTIGDMVILSFSQDKIIDSVSGGALISRIKNQELGIKSMANAPFLKQIKDKFYPLFTILIRATYSFGFGKLIHYLLKKMNLLSMPMDENLYKITSLPNYYANLAKIAFQNLEMDLKHRKKIAKIYARTLDKKILINSIIKDIDFSANLRFPILIKNRKKLINYLNKYNIYVSDIWYDAPIAPRRYFNKLPLNSSCPNSENISSLILNLPTHKNISEKDANIISERINTWLKSQ